MLCDHEVRDPGRREAGEPLLQDAVQRLLADADRRVGADLVDVQVVRNVVRRHDAHAGEAEALGVPARQFAGALVHIDRPHVAVGLAECRVEGDRPPPASDVEDRAARLLGAEVVRIWQLPQQDRRAAIELLWAEDTASCQHLALRARKLDGDLAGSELAVGRCGEVVLGHPSSIPVARGAGARRCGAGGDRGDRPAPTANARRARAAAAYT